MLIGLAIDPECFGPSVVVDRESRSCAERMLDSILANAVLVCTSEDEYLKNLIEEVESLSTRLGSDIQIRLAEILKNQRRCVVGVGQGESDSILDSLRISATTLRADLVVCKNQDDVASLQDLRNSGIEVCDLYDFSRSAAEQKRCAWTQPQKLDEIDAAMAASTVGAAVKYTDEIAILDYTIASAAKKASDRAAETDADRMFGYLKGYAKGIVYVVDQWFAHSPFGGDGKIDITIVTQGKLVGTLGYFDPAIIGTWIDQAIRDVDRNNRIDSIDVQFKLDTRPRIFLERFIFAGQSCWGMQHGADHFGKLVDVAGRRQPTFITPDCAGYRQLVSQIMNLPDAV